MVLRNLFVWWNGGKERNNSRCSGSTTCSILLGRCDKKFRRNCVLVYWVVVKINESLDDSSSRYKLVLFP